MRGVGVFGVQLLGAFVGFLVHISVSQIVGDEQYGMYSFVLSWLEMMMLAGVLGMDISVLRHFSKYIGQKNVAGQSALASYGRRYVLKNAGLTAIATISLFSILTFVSKADGRVTVPFLICCLAMLFASQNKITFAILRALRQPIWAAGLATLVRPAFLGVGVVATSYLFHESFYTTATNVIGCYLAATILTGTIAYLVCESKWRRINEGAVVGSQQSIPGDALTDWRSSAFSMAFASSFRTIMLQSNILLLGLLSSYQDAGYFAAVVRIMNVAVFGLAATNFVIAPMISEAHAAGDLDKLRSVLRSAAKLIMLFTLPILILILVLGGWLLRQFGSEFASAYPCLVILSLAQLINTFCGCVGYLMTMTGNEKQASRIWGWAAAVCILLNMILIPTFGILGAAIASTLATATWNFWMLYYVNKHLRLNPTLFG